jgi:hypothetical protein
MGYSTRAYLFAEDGVKRVAIRVVEGLYRGDDALPAYAGTRQKIASVTIEVNGRNVTGIARAIGHYWKFDKIGKLDRSTRTEISTMPDLFFGTTGKGSGDTRVIDLAPKLKRKEWEREHRWELSKADLDLIAADLEIDGFPRREPRLRNVHGTAAKPDPLTYEGRDAIDKIGALFFQILGHLDGLSEPALKGIASEARRRGEPDSESLWVGLAGVADRKREILARHRNGKGSWYAVIEGFRREHASNSGEMFTIEFEKCNSLKTAEAAARRLLAKNAEHFSDVVGIEAAVYSELEWSPDDWDLHRSRSALEEGDDSPDEEW